MANSTPLLVPSSLNPADPTPNLNAVLALDLGTHTGWALWQADRLITSGTVHFAPQRFDFFLRAAPSLFQFFLQLVLAFSQTLVLLPQGLELGFRALLLTR